jgi:hypothetical protein
MSYDLMVLDKHKRFTDRIHFLEWYDELTQWQEDIDYNDYKHATSNLQQWFLDMKDIVPPLNGEFAPQDEDLGKSRFQEGDYSIAKEAIYVAFAWSDAEQIRPIVEELAKKHDVAFFDISRERINYPDGFVLNLSESNPHPHSSLTLFEKIKRFFHR